MAANQVVCTGGTGCVLPAPPGSGSVDVTISTPAGGSAADLPALSRIEYK